jgi:hypothetical protein
MYFINLSHHSVCLHVCPYLFVRLWLGKKFIAATNAHTTIEELLGRVVFMQCLSYQGKNASSSSKNFLFLSFFRSVSYSSTHFFVFSLIFLFCLCPFCFCYYILALLFRDFIILLSFVIFFFSHFVSSLLPFFPYPSSFLCCLPQTSFLFSF